MRISLTKSDGQENLFPNKIPYEVGDTYDDYPSAFNYGFSTLVKKFEYRFSNIDTPSWLTDFRHGLAHGMVAKINHSKKEQLIKFSANPGKAGKLTVEYAEELDSELLLEKIKALDLFRSILINQINNL